MLRSHLVIISLLLFSFFLGLPYVHYGIAIIIGAILHHENSSKPPLITFEDVLELLQTSVPLKEPASLRS